MSCVIEEPGGPHRCADKSSFLTQLSRSEAELLHAKGTFQGTKKLQNKLENKQSHWVIHIVWRVEDLKRWTRRTEQWTITHTLESLHWQFF